MSTDPAEKRSKGRRPPIPTPADISPPPPPPPPPRPEAPIAVLRPDAKQSKSSSAPQVSTPKIEETQAVGVLWPYAIAVMVVAFIGFVGWSVIFDEQEPAHQRQETTAPITGIEIDIEKSLPPAAPVDTLTSTPPLNSEPPNAVLNAPAVTTNEIAPQPTSAASSLDSPPNVDLESSIAPLVSWSAEEGFPFQYAAALEEHRNAQYASNKNELRKRRQLKESEIALCTILDNARRAPSRQTARCMVISTSNEHVTLLADISAKWLSRGSPASLLQILPGEPPSPWCVTWISLSNRPGLTIDLRIGEQIDAEVAAALQWGDSIVVAFDVVDILDMGSAFRKSQSVLSPASLVQVRNLECIEREPHPHPIPLWPDPDTLPRILTDTQRHAHELLPLLAPTELRVRAKIRVDRVTDRAIILENHIRSADVATLVRFKTIGVDDLQIPIEVIGERAAAELPERVRFVVEFTVKKLQPGTELGGSSLRGYYDRFVLDALIDDLQYISRYKPLR